MGLEVCRSANAMRSAPAILALALVALAALIFANPAIARSADELAEINHEIGELVAAGEDDKAIALAERYAAIARDIFGEDDPEYATAISWLGSIYLSEGRYAEAQQLLRQALAVRKNALGRNHPLVGTSLKNLAGLYQKQGRVAEATPLLAEAAAVRARAKGRNMLEAMPREFHALQAAGKTVDASRLANHYVALARERYGANQPGVVPALMEAAALFEQQGKLIEAEALLRQALKIRTEVFGQRSPEVADSAEALGRFYRTAKRYDKAERQLKRAYSIRKAVFGKRSAQVVTSMEALGGLYGEAGRDAEAKKLLAEAKGLQGTAQRRLEAKKETPTYAVVKVYYATDRKNTRSDDPAEVYSGERGTLVYGTATVSIPKDHSPGALESPSIWRFEWSDEPERFVVLLSVAEQTKAQFFKSISSRVRSSAGKSAFIFVHGYNVTFMDAARRTAQMAYDLGFGGAPVFYSWPSQASFASYKEDENNARWTRLNFKKFLKDFAAQSDAEHIYLVAHSMGTRVLTGALKELALEDPTFRDRFDEVILAAPDIDAETFQRDIAPKILAREGGTTLYASSGDYALLASKEFAGYRRVGDTSEGVIITPGVDTIDASAIRTDFLGHSYYGGSRSVLADLRDLILKRKRPEKRSHLSPVTTPDGSYWTFSPQ